MKVGLVCSGFEGHGRAHFSGAGIHDCAHGKAHRCARVACFVHDEDAAAAHRNGSGAKDSRRFAKRLRLVTAAHHDRMEFAIENGGDNGARYHTGRGNAHDDLGVVGAHDLEGERARKLSEQRPLYLKDSLALLACRLAWWHANS